MKRHKSGATNFGEVDLAEELRLLCDLPTYKHAFQKLGVPTLAVYRSHKMAGRYRGHAKIYRWYIHMTTTRHTLIGDTHEVLAHELAHLICHVLGLDDNSGDHRERCHHRKFDEVLRVLIRERHGFDIEVGERKHMYDYSHRVGDFLNENLENGYRTLWSYEPSKEEKRQNKHRQDPALWGFIVEDHQMMVKPRANQRLAIDEVIGWHMIFCERRGLAGAELGDPYLTIPLEKAVVENLIYNLRDGQGCDETVWKAGNALADRIQRAWDHIASEQFLLKQAADKR